MTDGDREWERQQQHRATERQLQAHFAGRRSAFRTRKSLACSVVGQSGSFDARLVDISRSGALIVILDCRFASGEDLDQLMLYTARVWHHFPDGLELQIGERDVRAVANVVRVNVLSTETRFPYEIGLHFRTELTKDECDRLGIEHADDRSEAAEKNNSVSNAFDRLLTTMTPNDTDDA